MFLFHSSSGCPSNYVRKCFSSSTQIEVGFFCLLLTGKNSLLSFCMIDKKRLRRLIIGSNSVAGMAALILLVLSSVSVEFNHCVHSS